MSATTHGITAQAGHRLAQEALEANQAPLAPRDVLAFAMGFLGGLGVTPADLAAYQLQAFCCVCQDAVGADCPSCGSPVGRPK